MPSTEYLSPELQRIFMCHADIFLLRRAGHFRAALLPSPSHLLPFAGLPSEPVLVLEGGDETDPSMLQSIAREGDIETCQFEFADGHTFLIIAISSDNMTLAVLIDPWQTSGQSLLMRWQATGVLRLALCQVTGWTQVLELCCTNCVRDILRRPVPDRPGELDCFPVVVLPEIHETVRTGMQLENLITVVPSDFEQTFLEPLFNSLASSRPGTSALH